MIQTHACHQTILHPPPPPPSLPHGMWFRSHPTEIRFINQSTHSAGKGSQPSEANMLSPSRYTGDGRCGDRANRGTIGREVLEQFRVSRPRAESQREAAAAQMNLWWELLVWGSPSSA
ncbi:hypothetical protein RSOLAG1IB_12188 [Rhizoctonia solani AG-1 IB]|uniref:Uncharacterized protein n=1 Tax=Thanatephorus cucumeris (strain AG1-IB / isolate 7/3/14) TaxID=1108050 RepID=A0A0B7FR74_THACB|nr:hypothetical protein RSOLAG1IB_12188 [Rhizoctonia solani AG-1 IB]